MREILSNRSVIAAIHGSLQFICSDAEKNTLILPSKINTVRPLVLSRGTGQDENSDFKPLRELAPD